MIFIDFLPRAGSGAGSLQEPHSLSRPQSPLPAPHIQPRRRSPCKEASLPRPGFTRWGAASSSCARPRAGARLCSSGLGLAAAARLTGLRGARLPGAWPSKEPGWPRGAPCSPPAAAGGMSGPETNRPALATQARGWPSLGARSRCLSWSLVRRAERP